MAPHDTAQQLGTKFDQEKPNWDLLPFEQLRGVVRVLMHGARKYAPNNWKHVEPARERYFAAMMRHLDAWHGGELRDKESGEHHLSHAICSALFLLWFDGEGVTKADSVPELGA